MSDAIATTDVGAQADIELASGVTLTGMGSDVDAIREQLEERHEEITPQPKEPTPPVDQPARKTRGQKRFDELTAEREEEKRRADAAEARAKELEARLAAPAVAQPAASTAAPVVAAVEPRPKPTEDLVGTKYQTYADFIEDLADWKAEQREIKFRQDIDARTTERIEADRASRTLATAVSDAFTRGRAAYQDFDAVLKSADGVMIPPAYQQAITRVPNFEHVMYALAKDQAKLKSILTITDGVQLGLELAQLISREPVASPASTAPVVRTTNAPAPIQPVGAGTRTTSPTLQELAETNYDAYKAARAAGQTH